MVHAAGTDRDGPGERDALIRTWNRQAARSVAAAALSPRCLPHLPLATGGSAPIEPELRIDQVESVRTAGASGVPLAMSAQLMPHQKPAGEELCDCLRHDLVHSTARD